MTKPWRFEQQRGDAVDLPQVRALAAGPDPGNSPKILREGGRVFAHYRRSRLHLDRSAWESLPSAQDVLVLRIAADGEAPFTIAMTRAELDRVFGEVRLTESWETVRYYSFPKLPPAVAAFRVGATATAEVGTNRAAPATLRRPAPFVQAAESRPERSPVAEVQESPAYLASVAAWRNAWRPDRVRVLLIAESHVREVDGDASVRVDVPDFHRSLPSSFCRLIYCLGYGESELCSPAPLSNAGTWQFWDILGSIAGGSQPRMPRKGESTLEQRLRWKVAVLEWLRKQGVWLVDASVSAIYAPGGTRNEVLAKQESVRTSFVERVWPHVAQEPIEQTWIIGHGVRDALRGLPAVERARAIVQPQGDRGTGRHAPELAEMVAALRPIVRARP